MLLGSSGFGESAPGFLRLLVGVAGFVGLNRRLGSMATIPAQIRDEFGPSPIKHSVLRFLTTHRLCAVWEGKDPGALKCRGRNDELRKRRPIVVDDRVIDIVKRPPRNLFGSVPSTIRLYASEPGGVEPYQDDLAHLPPFCVAGRDV
nr:hypothetical protein CFP56_46054 [Quercus suber]